MATKSIYKNVVIKDKQLIRNLASALENAQEKTRKDVCITKPWGEVKKGQIRGFLGDQS